MLPEKKTCEEECQQRIAGSIYESWFRNVTIQHVEKLQKHVHAVMKEKNNTITNLRVELKSLEKDVGDMKAAKEDLKLATEKRMEYFRDKYDQALKAYEKTVEKTAQTEKNNKEAAVQISKQEKLIFKLKTKLRKRKEKLNAILKKKKEILQLNDRKDSIIEEEKQKVCYLAETVKQKETALISQREENEQLQKKIVEDVKATELKNEKFLDEIAELKEKIIDKDIILQSHQITIDLAKKEVVSLNEIIAAKESEILKLGHSGDNTKYKEIEAESCHLKVQNKELRTLNERLSKENQELKVTVSNLQKSFNGKINELSKLKLHNNNAVRKNSEDKPSDRKGIVLEVKDRVETISAENKDSFANLRSKTVKNSKSLMVLANARKKMNINNPVPRAYETLDLESKESVKHINLPGMSLKPIDITIDN